MKKVKKDRPSGQAICFRISDKLLNDLDALVRRIGLTTGNPINRSEFILGALHHYLQHLFDAKDEEETMKKVAEFVKPAVERLNENKLG